MLKHRELELSRIESFLNETLQPRLWRSQVPLQAAVYQPESGVRDYRVDRIAPEEAEHFAYTPVEPGFAWGPASGEAWFRFMGEIPVEWNGQTVVALLDCGAEAIVWEGDDPVQGIDAHHGEFMLSQAAQGGAAVSLTVQATGGSPLVSIRGAPQDISPTPFTFHHAALALYDTELFGLYYDLKVALGVLKEQSVDTPRFEERLVGLDTAINACDPDDPGSVVACRKAVASHSRESASAASGKISAVGYAPVGPVGPWPSKQTALACLHTFSTVLRLMEQYPEFRFVCSQAVLYAEVKRLSPKLYARIKARIKTGQWQVAGSLWVEANGHFCSGESLVRQILYEKSFFLDEFGIETHAVRLPEVSGCPASLPQILKRARIDTLLTQQWSREQAADTFPYRTFLWQGIDGTRLFTHLLPADTPKGDMSPQDLAQSSRGLGDPDGAARSLYLFGHNEGGSGPTAEMLENARRLQDVEGMPAVTIEPTGEFFRKAEAEVDESALWVGEFGVRAHTGATTGRARNRRSSRKAELALRDAEFLSVVSPAGLAAYPQSALERLWKTVLLPRGDSLLSGTSTTEVDQDNAEAYAEVARDTDTIIREATESLAAEVNTRGMKRPVLVVSNLSHFANEAVSVPLRAGENPVTAIGPEGDAVAVQILAEANGSRSALFVAKNAPLHGYAVWDLNATTVPVEDDEDAVSASRTHLENASLRVEFDAATGLITRLFDRDNEREILHEAIDVRTSGKRDLNIHQCANQLVLHADKPLSREAGDGLIAASGPSRIVTELRSATVVENGPVRGAIRFERVFGKSRIVQTVRLTAGSMRLDFVTEVDWQETDTLLEAAFPVAINGSRATFEIPYGHVERPTHRNTGQERGRFEVCAQKWADLSEGNYGVALLNDCKYGYDIQGHTLRLTLLRAPQASTPTANGGSHLFTYSLLPHNGDFREGEVVENAYALNSPPVASALPANRPGPLPLERSFFEVDNAAVFIEVIKHAEKEKTVIVRLYEVHNTRGSVTLTTTLSAKSAWYCDLMENSLAEIPLHGGEMLLPIQPFEIVTVKLLL